MFLVWLLGGIIAVSAAYFAPGLGTDLWPNLCAAALAAGVYIAMLLIVFLRKPVPLRYIIGGWIMFLCSAGIAADGIWQLHTQSVWRAAALHRIAVSVNNGCLVAAANPPLIKVLREHYSRTDSPTEGIGATFRRCMPAAVPGPNISPILQKFADSTFMTSVEYARAYISALSDTEVVLVTEANWNGALNPAFKNFDGRTGKAQQIYRLTAKGVTYESQN